MRPGPFAIALAMLLVVSLLPGSWVSPWSGRIAELVSLPLVPLGDGFKALRSWAVPSQETVITGQEAAVLEEQANLLRQSLDEARKRNQDLRRELERYRALDERGLGGRYRFVDARLVGAEPFRSGERLHVINAGTARGVRPGSQVVFRKDILLGLVVGERIGRTRAMVRPVESRQNGRLRASVLLGDEIEISRPEIQRVQALLEPDGTGWTAMIAEADAAGIRPGHQVVVDDDTWGDAVGMRIGRVTAVRPSTSSPLWLELRVEPIRDLGDLHAVEVRVPVPAAKPGAADVVEAGGGA